MNASALYQRGRGVGAWVVVFVSFLLMSVGVRGAAGAEVIPAKPEQYFNDYANVVSPEVVDTLNSELEQFERDSSDQVRVVIYPKMQSDSSIDDYTVRVAEAWGFGKKKVNNGIVLFVFVQDHSDFIQVGSGLEGAVTDIQSAEILREIAPLLKDGKYDDAMSGAVTGIMAAAKGEYKGTGKTENEKLAGSIMANLGCIGWGIGGFWDLGCCCW